VINSKSFVAYLVIIFASTVGIISLLLFGFFLFGYSFSVVELGYGRTGVLAWDSLLCLLFFVQHSTMIRKAFRQRLSAIVPSRFQGVLYTVASAAVLIALILFWQNTGQTLVSLQDVSRWLAHGVFFASLLGMIWAMRALRSFDTFGIQPVLAHVGASNVRAMPLIIRGPYRWVRHPLYFFTLVLIWCCPDLTMDRVLFNTLFTAWIMLGTLLEERDLVAEFDETYNNYQRRVPMLIPWKLHKPFKCSFGGN
jgi:protein-S-isoprenylcysteine O-methyltransferase Ste14